MDPFIPVKAELEKYLPGVELSVDTPKKEDGIWWMDVRLQGKAAVIQWNPILRKYGVSWQDLSAFTHQPEEVFNDPMSTVERVLDIFKGWV